MKPALLKIWVLVLFFALAAPAAAQTGSVEFIQLTNRQGLSGGTVWAILQDRQGFMWFCTEAGLNRYDGYDFVIYKYQANNPNSLSDNDVRSIYQDRQGMLWIGTRNGGLNRLDPPSGQFTRYRSNPDDPTTISNDGVMDIYEDKEGFLWVATLGGLNRFDHAAGRFTRYLPDPADPNSISGKSVMAMYEDRDGILWLGTEDGGLNRFDRKNGRFTSYQYNPNDPTSISHNGVVAIYGDEAGYLWLGTRRGGMNRFDPRTGKAKRYLADETNPLALPYSEVTLIQPRPDGRYWVGTLGGGLSIFDPKTEQFTTFKNNPDDPTSLAHNSIRSLYTDRSGLVWIGLDSNGLSAYSPLIRKFSLYQNQPNNPDSLGANIVSGFFESRDGSLWIAHSKGFDKLDRKTGHFTHYFPDPAHPDNSLSLGKGVEKILEDSAGLLWISTWGGGLNRFDPKTGQFTHYLNDPQDPASLGANDLLSVYQDSVGMIWVGTWRGGLNRLDPKTGKFTVYKNKPDDPHSLSDDVVGPIIEDKQGNLWAGTWSGGLSKLDPKTGQFTSYQNDPNNPNSLSPGRINTLYQDHSGVLWVGNTTALNKFDPATGLFTHYSEQDGLANGRIVGILEDEQGNLWLTTNSGISCFNPATGVVRNYDVLDGLQDATFSTATCKSSSGEMFFGGSNGFNAFYPNQLKDNPFIPPVALVDFQLFNQSVPVGGPNPFLSKSINDMEEIVLKPDQSVFSIEFAALNYQISTKNRYSYKMEGFDKEWSPPGPQRLATYTNLDPGRYIFKVKGSNNDGVWNEEAKILKITVLPHWWETPWFRVLVVVGVVGGSAGIFTWRVKTIEIQKRELETRVAERTQELSQEIIHRRQVEADLVKAKVSAELANQAKSIFLANMSHELRTPLNAILGFCQFMSQDDDLTPEHHDYLDIINRSGEHLLMLINNVLDLSKIEAGRMQLYEQSFDLYRLLDDLQDMFQLRADDKLLELSVERDDNTPRYVRGDMVKLRQVLINLLSNALKFTQEGGIILRVTSRPGEANQTESQSDSPASALLHFAVEDTGPGIAEAELEKVFEAFVQTAAGQATHEGTGLGLPLSREFVRLMGGNLAVSSEVGRGTTFEFGIRVTLAEADDDQAGYSRRRAIALEPSQPGYRLLIVDDRLSNRQLLLKLLGSMGFELREAVNGAEALAIWEIWSPHLIWLDVRMPVLSGYEVIRQIKSTPQGKDTVIIVLTASALEEEEALVRAAGCDDFLRKPFREADIFNLMSKHLGVRYIYEEKGTKPAMLKPAQESPVSPHRGQEVANFRQRLISLPAELTTQLEYAAAQANPAMLFQLIESIQAGDPSFKPLGEALNQMAQNFEYLKILALLQAAKTHRE